MLLHYSITAIFVVLSPMMFFFCWWWWPGGSGSSLIAKFSLNVVRIKMWRKQSILKKVFSYTNIPPIFRWLYELMWSERSFFPQRISFYISTHFTIPGWLSSSRITQVSVKSSSQQTSRPFCCCTCSYGGPGGRPMMMMALLLVINTNAMDDHNVVRSYMTINFFFLQLTFLVSSFFFIIYPTPWFFLYWWVANKKMVCWSFQLFFCLFPLSTTFLVWKSCHVSKLNLILLITSFHCVRSCDIMTWHISLACPFFNLSSLSGQKSLNFVNSPYCLTYGKVNEEPTFSIKTRVSPMACKL